MTVILAGTWQPRGELNRLKRLYDQICDLYDEFVLAVSVKGLDEVESSLSELNIPYVTYADYSGRYTVLQKATEFSFDYLHYADFDRLLHWLETRPDELRDAITHIQKADCTVIGRTEEAFGTHPQSMIQTEKLFNDVFSNYLGQSMDFGAGSRGFSRHAVETILDQCTNKESLQMDVGWTVLLKQAGLSIQPLAVDGLDWETPDQFRDEVATEEIRQKFIEKADANPKNWALRVQVAQKIMQSGLNALNQPINVNSEE